jgi:two-component system, NtrC family, sensor kinase
MDTPVPPHSDRPPSRSSHPRLSVPAQTVIGVLLAAILVPLSVANVAIRARSQEVEDGVLWVTRTDDVVAAEVAPDTPAARAGIQAGDVLLEIDGRSIDRPVDVVDLLHSSRAGRPLRYTLLRLGTNAVVDIRLAPVPHGNTTLYYVLAAVGLFTLFVGLSVRLRRPGEPATLHFLWLTLAFFGTFGFSFNGSLNRLDWVFYWIDTGALLLLAPLFLHFTLFFPERPRGWVDSRVGPFVIPMVYVPALLLGAARVMAVTRAPLDARFYVSGIVGTLERAEPVYLSLCVLGGLAVLVRAFGRVRSGTARRQLRWIVWGTLLGGTPFAFGYAVPFAFGVTPSLAMQLTVIPLGLLPLAFASAIVRYRLMDVEVIVKRMLVYAVAVSAILAIYAVLLRVAGAIFLEDAHKNNTVIAMLATLVVVLLARPVKTAIQNTIDRAFYRDRYDYRRALVGFARDLNADLDLYRLSERLVTRVTETLLVDRMAVMLVSDRTGEFTSIRTAGLGRGVLTLARVSEFGVRLENGQAVALDDPSVTRGFNPDEVEHWRDRGVFYFIPCVSKEGTNAALVLGRKRNGEPLTSEDTALLTAVAGQVATAIENGRLYQQLHVKAEELDRLREFNESILESLDAGLIVVDVDDRIVRWNRALEQIYGLARIEAVGRTLDEVFDVAFVEALRGARRDAPEGATLYRMSVISRRPEPDARRLVNTTLVPLQPPAGVRAALSGTIIILDDVTDRVRLEEQLQISDKMASIGLLAAGVAHEVNTPLTGISSFTQMLLDNADPADPKTQMLEKIERQTFRAAKIVNSLLNLSRPGTPDDAQPGPVDLNMVIADVLGLLEHQLKLERIQVRRELSVPAPIVMGVEYKLQQVFLNLFLNARDAMPKGGWLSISTRTDGASGVAEVADTGSGIPSEHLSRIYDPFFTTKTTGQGTGLGLSITYGIVREHNGAIQCDSAVGAGTRFTVSVPLAERTRERSTRAVH